MNRMKKTDHCGSEKLANYMYSPMRPEKESFTYDAGCPERKQMKMKIPGRKGVATRLNPIQTKCPFPSLPLKERAFRPPSKSGIKRAAGGY